MEISSGILMPIAIGIIMFGIGLDIPFSSFKRVFIQPRAFITGLSSQLLLLPIIAFIIASLWDMDPAYKAGLVLIAACPGGTASNLVTYMLRGRVALCVSLTAFNSFIIVLTIPLIVNLATDLFMGEHHDIGLSFFETMKNISLTVALPVLAGMLVYNSLPSYTDKLKKPLRYILPGILLVVFTYVILSESSNQSEATLKGHLSLIWPALLLNLTTILTGYIIARKIGVNHDGSFTIAIELGLQNSALAIFIAHEIIDNKDMLIVALIYASFSFFTTWGFAWILKRWGLRFMEVKEQQNL